MNLSYYLRKLADQLDALHCRWVAQIVDQSHELAGYVTSGATRRRARRVLVRTARRDLGVLVSPSDIDVARWT